MESTEFTNAFFLSRLLTSLRWRTLAVDCVTKHVEHRRTGRGGWEQKIILFGQNWCTVRAKTEKNILLFNVLIYLFSSRSSPNLVTDLSNGYVFISHVKVLYFRNVDLDLPTKFALFWTPVLSRYGEENLTSRKNHLVHLWPTSFIRANYVQPSQQNFSRTRMILSNLKQSHLDLFVRFDVQPWMLIIFSVPTEIKKKKRFSLRRKAAHWPYCGKKCCMLVK